MKQKVTVFGSFVVDLMARTPHLPAPAETVKGSFFKQGAGGKGFNQGVAAHKAGGDVAMITKLGRDSMANVALDVMTELNMPKDFLFYNDDVATGIALIMVDENSSQNEIVIVPGACGTITAEDIKSVEQRICDSAYILLQLEVNQDANEAVAKLAKEMVDITHECGCEAMMFLGDHWIGTEPFMPEFKTIGLDAVVGSVGNGSTLRLISDIEGVKYTEGRFLPYFFPDTFHEGGDPVREAKENWVTARRAILRKPIDRIGYGGYLKLALQFPEFVDYVESVCNEFRELYENIKGTTPYCVKRVAVLNCWGKMRAWGCHMVHHALYYKQNYSYAGVIEMLSGAPFDVKFISFEDIKNDPHLLDSLDVIINVGDADTAHTGGIWWEDPEISSAIRKFVWNGGGFIGVGEPSGHPYQGHILQLASVLGVEEENGFTLNYDKYNWEEHPDHFILQDADQPVDFGEGKKNIYALEGTEVLVQRNKEVQMAAHDFGKGRAVYISGVPYSFANSRTLYRAILWSAHSEEELHTWFSSNYNVEVHAYVKNGKYCVVNNTYEPQDTTVYTTGGSSFALHLDANEIKWYEI